MKSESEYWVPKDGESILLLETPHFICYWGIPDADGRVSRFMTLKFHPSLDKLEPGEIYEVIGVVMNQDIHYEYVYVKPKKESRSFKENEVSKLEIPLRYFTKIRK